MQQASVSSGRAQGRGPASVIREVLVCVELCADASDGDASDGDASDGDDCDPLSLAPRLPFLTTDA
jgi:hypothetical protein